MQQPNEIKSNPDNPTPAEIESQIIAIEVSYIDFGGKQQQGIIEVSRDVEEDVKEFFKTALELSFPIEKVVCSSDPEYLWVDTKLTANNATSGFNYRVIKRTGLPSLHGLGRAIDVNTRLNPYSEYDENEERTLIDPVDAKYDPSQPGTLTADHPLVTLMKERGWEWGGDWTKSSGRIDYQHFQKPLSS